MVTLVETRLGRGPELLLVPGWGMPAAVLRPWAERLAEAWRVRLLELPGQGEARGQQANLDQFIEELARLLADECIGVGWSLGGQLLLAAAARRPPAALLLLSASPRFCGEAGWSGVARERLAAMQAGLDKAPEQVLTEFLALLGSPGGADRRAVRRLRSEVLGGSDPQALAAGLAALESLDLRAGLSDLRLPAIWLSGDADPLIPVAATQWAAAQMPKARAVILREAGHMPFLTHPAAVEAELATLRQSLLRGEIVK